MAAKLIGHVAMVSTSTENPTDVVDFTVNYICSEYIGGYTSGQVVLRVTSANNDAQMQSALKSELAATINALAGTNFAAVDVRGLAV